jgi:hypothetical protein
VATTAVEGMAVPAWICVRCGVQCADTPRPPAGCPICADEREAVPEGGQRWTTADELATGHRSELREEEPGLVGIGIEPSFGIGQRALLVRTPHGNVLWDCISLFDDDARATVARWGGIAAICPSHPHFYGACVDVAEAFDARVLIPRADERWIQRPSSRITLFDDEVHPLPEVTVLRVGGHFAGSSVLHWKGGADGRGVLLTGDTIMVVEDRAWVSFMWSYPNLLPLGPDDVGEIARRVGRFPFARVYGGWWGHVIADDGAGVVARSAHRYVERVHGQRPGRRVV